MNKKLLAAAVAAAVVAAPAAFAESTVYGKMHASIDAIDEEGAGGTVRDNYEMESRSSRLGFKGSEDLGGGLKAIYQIEVTVDLTGGSGRDQSTDDAFGGYRNTFIGLSGDFGTFLVGKHDTPAKIAFYGAGNEALGDSVIDLNTGSRNPIGVFHEFRANNAIAYVSPSFSGFTLAAAVVPGEQTGVEDASENNNDGIADHYSLGLIYKGNGLRVGVGYESKVGLTEAVGADEANFDTLQIGASYTMNNFRLGLHYEDSEDVGFSVDEDREAWAISGKATFGNNAVSAVYTMKEDENDSGDTSDFEGWGLAFEHNFSKRTKAYVAYASGEDDEKDEEEDRFSLGMIHNF